MRAVGYLLGLLVFGTFLVATTPTASAAAYCVQGVKEPYADDPCDGVACYGHNQAGWQYCVPVDLCAFQTDCCYYTPDGNAFYCP